MKILRVRFLTKEGTHHHFDSKVSENVVAMEEVVLSEETTTTKILDILKGKPPE